MCFNLHFVQTLFTFFMFIQSINQSITQPFRLQVFSHHRCFASKYSIICLQNGSNKCIVVLWHNRCFSVVSSRYGPRPTEDINRVQSLPNQTRPFWPLQKLTHTITSMKYLGPYSRESPLTLEFFRNFKMRNSVTAELRKSLFSNYLRKTVVAEFRILTFMQNTPFFPRI